MRDTADRLPLIARCQMLATEAISHPRHASGLTFSQSEYFIDNSLFFISQAVAQKQALQRHCYKNTIFLTCLICEG